MTQTHVNNKLTFVLVEIVSYRMTPILQLILLSAVFTVLHSLRSFNQLKLQKKISMKALESDIVSVLEDTRAKYLRLSNVVSPEAEQEAEQLKEVAEKYGVYIEVKKMMTKLRSLYVNEASDKRKAKQLKSFIDLYKGKVEIEQLLREKAGFPSQKSASPEGLAELEALNKQVEELESKLDKVTIKIPEGKSTRLERFGY